jgi:hypothetical protein
MGFEDAWEKAGEFESEMIKNNDCEMNGGRAMETFTVEKEG